jgi:hypothetical protein
VGNQIILNMPSNITFAVDKATIQPQFNETLVSVGLVLKKFNKTVVDVYGHTDSGSDDYNQDCRSGVPSPLPPSLPTRRRPARPSSKDAAKASDRVGSTESGGPEPPRRNPAFAHPGLRRCR